MAAHAEERVDKLRPIPDPAFEISRHVESQAEVDCPEPRAADQVIGAEKTADWVLPRREKLSQDHLQARVPKIIPGTTP